MALLEVAPHNKGNQKKYDRVAGCLIAFAYRQSVIQGKEHFNDMLFFEVLEEKEADRIDGIIFTKTPGKTVGRNHDGHHGRGWRNPCQGIPAGRLSNIVRTVIIRR